MGEMNRATRADSSAWVAFHYTGDSVRRPRRAKNETNSGGYTPSMSSCRETSHSSMTHLVARYVSSTCSRRPQIDTASSPALEVYQVVLPDEVRVSFHVSAVDWKPATTSSRTCSLEWSRVAVGGCPPTDRVAGGGHPPPAPTQNAACGFPARRSSRAGRFTTPHRSAGPGTGAARGSAPCTSPEQSVVGRSGRQCRRRTRLRRRTGCSATSPRAGRTRCGSRT